MPSVANPVPPLFRSTFTANRTPLRPLVVTKFATLQRKRGIQEVINLGALCALCVQNKNAIVFYLTQRPQRTQNFQSKLRCRWSSRSLRATENAKGQSKRKSDISSSSSTFLISHSIFLLSHLTLIHPLCAMRSSTLSQGDSWLAR